MSYAIFFIAFVYSCINYSLFGAHWFPQTPEEAIADGIFAVIISLGCISHTIEKHIKSKEKSE